MVTNSKDFKDSGTEVIVQQTDFNNDSGLPEIASSNDRDVVNAMWGINPAVLKQITNVSKVYTSKHGMFASVPILCKGDDCAYKDVCMINKEERIYGSRCPMEIGAILARYEQWCNYFEIKAVNDVVASEDLVDATLIRDLVNVEVQMLRAENKVALTGDFMADTLLDIDKKCKPYFGKDISPEANFLLQLQDKKVKILNQLNATRKDKAKERNMSNNPSETAIKIFQEMKNMMKEKDIVDISNLQFDDEPSYSEIKIDETQPSEINTVIKPDEEELI